MNRTRLVATLTAGALALGIIAAPAAAAGPKGASIVDVAVAANTADNSPYKGQLDILITALQAASPSIIATLDGNGQYTVFAPTDSAFETTLGELGLSLGDVAGNRALLDKILLYHVARGERDSSDVVSSTQIRTLNGQFIKVSGTTLIDKNASSSNATIIVTDIPAANGVIHVIDRVLIPSL